MPNVLPAPAFRKSRPAHRGQVEGIVQLAVGEQAASEVIRAPWNSSLSRLSKVTLNLQLPRISAAITCFQNKPRVKAALNQS